MFIVLGYEELRIIARDFLCGQGRTHTEHKLHIDLTSGARFGSDEVRKNFAIEVEARERVRVRPAQAIGQAEVDELLHFYIRRHRVRRPAKRGDHFVSLTTNEVVPKFDAVAIIILRDGKVARGSVDIERGVFVFHTYRIAQGTENTRDFFTIVKLFLCKLARFMNVCLCKSFIIKDLGRAAGRARVSG